MICAAFLSNVLGGVLHAAGALLLGEPTIQFVWFGLITGAASGIVWGLIFAWARLLRLVIVVPVVLAFSIISLSAPLYEVFKLAEISQVAGVRRTVVISTVLHLTAFWAVFLAIAAPLRLRARQNVAP